MLEHSRGVLAVEVVSCILAVRVKGSRWSTTAVLRKGVIMLCVVGRHPRGKGTIHRLRIDRLTVV